MVCAIPDSIILNIMIHRLLLFQQTLSVKCCANGFPVQNSDKTMAHGQRWCDKKQGNSLNLYRRKKKRKPSLSITDKMI